MRFGRLLVLAVVLFGHLALAGLVATAPLVVAEPAMAQTKNKKKSKKVVKKPAAPAVPPVMAVDLAKKDNADLVILPSETTLAFGGCGTGDALLTGVVAIKNAGTGRESLTLSSPLVAAYLPEMLDLKDEDTVVNSMQQDEIVTKEIEIGRGKAKEFRKLNGTRKVYVVVDPYNAVDEANENNNVLVRDVAMTCK